LREATDERILEVPGVTRRHLAALRAAFEPVERVAEPSGSPSPTTATEEKSVGPN
jgi:hypothetical protein